MTSVHTLKKATERRKKKKICLVCRRRKKEEELLGRTGGLARPHRSTGPRRVGGWATTLTLALPVCLGVTWVAPDTRAAIQEANPFPVFVCLYVCVYNAKGS